MATGAIAHLKYDLDNYINALRRVSSLAATFLISDSLIRKGYLTEVEDFILSIEQRFKSELYPQKKIAIIEELKAETKLTEKEYQILRMKDYTTYIVTDIFEDQGVVKYAKIGGGVLSGGIQVASGLQIFRLSGVLNSKRMKGMGVILIAHGGNNLYETLYPVFYKGMDSGPLRDLYRSISGNLGGSDSAGDFSYSAIDFTHTAYSAFKMPVLTGSHKSILKKGKFEKPGTGKLFRNVSQDFSSKISRMNRPMRIFQFGYAANKFRMSFVEGNYRFNESEDEP